MIDFADYIISGLLNGKNQPTALWNKMFENIGNVPVGRGHEAEFTSQLTDLNTTELTDGWSKYGMLWKLSSRSY